MSQIRKMNNHKGQLIFLKTIIISSLHLTTKKFQIQFPNGIYHNFKIAKQQTKFQVIILLIKNFKTTSTIIQKK